MISLIVITHGLFGQELLRTAQDMIGRQEGVAGLAVTSEMGADNLSHALADTIEKLKSPEGYLILVDLMGGTPSNTALLKTKDLPSEIVTGVNLYMVLSTLRYRAGMGLKELAAKVAEDGRKAILLPKDLLSKKLGDK